MYLFKLKTSLTNNLINIPGWRTNRKVIVIESDDWGSIRMPSKESYNRMLSLGINVDHDPYCKFDNIANSDDLMMLFEALQSVKDKNGNPAKLTANCVVANPDFKKIKENNFNEYHYELFTETIKKQPYEDVFYLWKQGLKEKLFVPQFHGREHLNVKKWLGLLRDGNRETLIAFNENTFGLTKLSASTIGEGFMSEFNSGLKEDLSFQSETLESGLKHFYEIFEYQSKSFIATTYTWHPQIEKTLFDCGVRYLQGMISQKIPIDNGDNFKYVNSNYQGKRNCNGLIHLMRNCYFEPSQIENKSTSIDYCLKRIEIAFKWHKAAVISTHRLNFIGSIDEKNRSENNKLFRKLLSQIISKWPEVEFMSSDELGNEIIQSKYKQK